MSTICVTLNQTVFENTFNTLSAIYTNIQFLQELEEHNHLAFLDVFLTRHENQLLISVYRKRTYIGLYTIWSSLCPLKYKRNLINCLLHEHTVFATLTFQFTTNLNSSPICF